MIALWEDQNKGLDFSPNISFFIGGMLFHVKYVNGNNALFVFVWNESNCLECNSEIDILT